MRSRRSDGAYENTVTHTAARTSIFYRSRDIKHVSLDIFRQKNEYATSIQNVDFRDAVILTCEGKIVALIRGYLENRPAGEICDQTAGDFDIWHLR